MSREAHVRFCESVEVRFLRATRPVMESFYHTLKVELVHGYRYRTRGEAQTAVFDYIEIFYNRQRLHSSLDYQTPEAFERAA